MGQTEKWVALWKMGHALENRSHFKKWWKVESGIYLERWVTLLKWATL